MGKPNCYLCHPDSTERISMHIEAEVGFLVLSAILDDITSTPTSLGMENSPYTT